MNRAENTQWVFGSFRLDAAQHLLFREGELVPLSRKAADILLVLVEEHGKLVEKEELMRRVWPDSFVEESNLAVHISQLRKTINEQGDALHRIETIPRRGYRFVGDVKRQAEPGEVSPAFVAPGPSNEASPAPPPLAAPSPPEGPASTHASRLPAWAAAAGLGAVLLAAALAVLGWYLWPTRRAHSNQASDRQAPKHTLLLGYIANNTGDPVFDTTLREAIQIELEQSPYLTLVTEPRIQKSLRLMGKPADVQLTADLAREVCQRNAGEAVLDGWIARLGTQYVIGLRAVNCRTGDHVSDLQTTAEGKEQVLKALGDITGQLRARLGESLSMVQKFDTPIEEATTTVLEALQAYSIGRATMVQKGESASCLPFFQRAIRLDPDFAVAYAALGNAYSNLGETGQAAENIRKAYELREHVSEHERLYIESHYYQFVMGDLGKASQAYEMWAATYPEDEAPRTNLAAIYSNLGKMDQSLAQAREAVRIAPDDGQTWANLVDAYISLNQPDDALATANQAIARNLDTPELRLYLYDVAFLRHDQAGMQEQLKWAAGEPGVEDAFLNDEASDAAFSGRLEQARALTTRAIDAARHAGENETAAGYAVEAAQREALLGNASEARKMAELALSLAKDRDTRYGAATAFALAGAPDRALPIAAQLDKEFPDDTFVQDIYLPVIRGAVAIQQKDHARALKTLEPANVYELGIIAGLMPAYIRGEAYLAAGDGPHAAAEFQKVTDHPGVVLNSPIGPLAQLQTARAWRLAGNADKAKAAYDQFLSQWKDADPALSVLQEAKSENARGLQTAGK
jgi:DNA-binding winged helix-turn-helix (wHTH) protein/tetratricopeptide (TPR) repeat protein